MTVRLFGVPVTFDFTFFLALFLYIMLDQSGIGLFALLSVAVHESGHIAAMKLTGVRLKSLTFLPYGIKIEKRDSMMSYQREMIVYGAGIVGNFLMILAALLMISDSQIRQLLIAVNLVIAFFNLLPVGRLDGGQMLRLFLCSRKGSTSEQTLRFISRGIGFLVLTPLIVASVLLFFGPSHNFTLLLTCIYLAVTMIMSG